MKKTPTVSTGLRLKKSDKEWYNKVVIKHGYPDFNSFANDALKRLALELEMEIER